MSAGSQDGLFAPVGAMVRHGMASVGHAVARTTWSLLFGLIAAATAVGGIFMAAAGLWLYANPLVGALSATLVTAAAMGMLGLGLAILAGAIGRSAGSGMVRGMSESSALVGATAGSFHKYKGALLLAAVVAGIVAGQARTKR